MTLLHHITEESIYLGRYPQSKVKNAELIEELEYRLTHAADPITHIAYSSGSISNIIADAFRLDSNERYVEFDGERYRLFVDQSGVRLWYLYEPIEWIRVDEDESNITLCSKMILDYKPYNPNIMRSYDGDDYWCTILQTGQPANIFNGSFIDLWLNIDFMKDAFGDLNQNRDFMIPLTYKSNSDIIPGVYCVFDWKEEYFKDHRYVSLLTSEQNDKFKLGDHANKIATPYACSRGLDSDRFWLKDGYDELSVFPGWYGRLVFETIRKNEYSNVGMTEVDKFSGVVPVITVSKRILEG